MLKAIYTNLTEDKTTNSDDFQRILCYTVFSDEQNERIKSTDGNKKIEKRE